MEVLKGHASVTTFGQKRYLAEQIGENAALELRIPPLTAGILPAVVAIRNSEVASASRELQVQSREL